MTTRILPSVLTCLAIVGCNALTGPDDSGLPQMDSRVDGKTVRFQSDQGFEVTLDSFADAGYQWVCEVSNEHVVFQDGDPSYRQNNPNVCGGLCTATFRFHTNQLGESEIYLFERQPWMKDVAPIHTVRFVVVVDS